MFACCPCASSSVPLVRNKRSEIQDHCWNWPVKSWGRVPTLSFLIASSADVNLWGASPSTCACQPRSTIFQSACATSQHMHSTASPCSINNSDQQHMLWKGVSGLSCATTGRIPDGHIH